MAPPPAIIYQFKITLMDSDPCIWRRIQVPENYTFWDLHCTIQDAMGWKDCHLHTFRKFLSKRYFIEICTPDEDLGLAIDQSEQLPEHETPISEHFVRPGDWMGYEYDFGDGWLHEILLEGVFLKEGKVRYPRCTGGQRACPPEDCGGIYGYARLLEILASPDHPEYRNVVKWLGVTPKKPFLPEVFDPDKIKFANPRTRWAHIFE